MQKLLIVTVILLAGCSNYDNLFQCKLGKGVNCTSVSNINRMVDSDTFNDAGNLLATKVKKETIKVANKTPFPMIIANNLHHTIVHRIPETTLRIWVAPYVSMQDGYIEAQYVHEILEPGAWREKR